MHCVILAAEHQHCIRRCRTQSFCSRCSYKSDDGHVVACMKLSLLTFSYFGDNITVNNCRARGPRFSARSGCCRREQQQHPGAHQHQHTCFKQATGMQQWEPVCHNSSKRPLAPLRYIKVVDKLQTWLGGNAHATPDTLFNKHFLMQTAYVTRSLSNKH